MFAGRKRLSSTTRQAGPLQTFVSLGIVFSIWLTLLLPSGQVHAQGYAYTPPRFEAGLLLTAIELDVIGEKPVGIGGRFTYNHFENLAFEAELSHFPEDPSGDFGETQALFGVKAGGRFDDFGLFAKVRPGFIHFGGGEAAERLSDKTHFACDVGGVLEYYPSPRWLLRADFGDTIIPFGGTRFISPFGGPGGPRVIRLGTTHNSQSSFGFAVRF
jgi:hypothetical protein